MAQREWRQVVLAGFFSMVVATLLWAPAPGVGARSLDSTAHDGRAVRTLAVQGLADVDQTVEGLGAKMGLHLATLRANLDQALMVAEQPHRYLNRPYMTASTSR